MVPKTVDIFMQIKRYGFLRTKDDMGHYFEKDGARYSCVKHGHLFFSYHNKKINNQWVLQGKSNYPMDLENALMWVLRQIYLSGASD